MACNFVGKLRSLFSFHKDSVTVQINEEPINVQPQTMIKNSTTELNKSGFPLNRPYSTCIFSIKFSLGSSSLRETIAREEQRELWTIYRVPRVICRLDEATYKPRSISIGPYHRGRRDLEANNELKWGYAHDFLSRNSKIKLDNIVKAMKEIEGKARKCYRDDYTYLSSDDFVKMMVCDGCFILEVFLKIFKKETEDELFTTIGMFPHIIHDMFLLENQIPFFILECLFGFIIGKEDQVTSLLDVLSSFLQSNPKKSKPSMKVVHHLLHFFYLSIYPNLNSNKKSQSSIPDSKNMNNSSFCYSHQPQAIPCATVLHQIGVKFEKSDDPHSILDINFENGLMKIPLQSIDDGYNPLIRNLIAFEQCHRKSETFVTSYALLMKCLIKTSKDVDLLQQHGIIENRIGSNKEVALLFNSLGKHAFINHLPDIYKDVIAYCEIKRHKWW